MPNRDNGNSRVVVVGAGIVGASIAYRIAARGYAVTLIDKASPGSGASSHSFAWINAGLKAPLAYHNLNRRSMDMWEQFAARIADDGDSASVGLRWGGKVSWVTERDGAERLQSEVRQMQAWGYPSRIISVAELRELEPSLAVDGAAAAEYSENEAQVEPQMVVDACVRRLSELGGTVLTNTEVVELSQSDDGSVRAVETTSGEIECDIVALAAGTDVTPLAAMAGVHVPQYRSPGVVIRTNPLPRALQNVPVIYAPASADGRQEIHIRQCADGRMMIGEGTQESLAEDDSQEHADDLLDRARRFLPALDGARAVAVPVGWRPMPLDGYPIMGFTQEAPNLYIALTHSGVTLAPLISQLSMLEICDGAVVDAVLSPYRLERFA